MADIPTPEGQSTLSTVNARLKLEVVIALYAARAYLPRGITNTQFFLIFKLVLPLVDVATDWINAGLG